MHLAAGDPVAAEQTYNRLRAYIESLTRPDKDDLTVHRIEVGRSPVRGKATAPVTIVEFADFQCPFCGRVAPTIAEVVKIYGDKVRLVWKNNPLAFHPRAEPAAEFAMDARAQKGDAGFWAAHDLQTATTVVGRLTDCVLLIRPGRVEAVVQELQKMGHTPQTRAGERGV